MATSSTSCREKKFWIKERSSNQNFNETESQTQKQKSGAYTYQKSLKSEITRLDLRLHCFFVSQITITTSVITPKNAFRSESLN